MGLDDRELKPDHRDSEASKLLKEILRSNTKLLEEHSKGGKKSGLKGPDRSESAPSTPLVGAAARCRQNPEVASNPGELAKLSRERLRREAGAISGLDEDRAPCVDLEMLRRAVLGADERYIGLGAGSEFWPLLQEGGRRIEAICDRLADAEEELRILRRKKHLPDRTSKVTLVPRPEDNARREKKQVEEATAKFVDTLRFEIEEVDADGKKVKVDLLEQLERKMTGDVSFNQLRNNFDRYPEHEPHPWLVALTDHALKDEAVFHKAMWGQTMPEPSRRSAGGARLPVCGRHVVLGGANESPLAQRRVSGTPVQARGSVHSTPMGRPSMLRRDVSAPGRLSMAR